MKISKKEYLGYFVVFVLLSMVMVYFVNVAQSKDSEIVGVVQEAPPMEPGITFNTSGDAPKEYGRIYIKDDKLFFEGSMDESAQIFVDYLKKTWDKEIERIRAEERWKATLSTLKNVSKGLQERAKETDQVLTVDGEHWKSKPG